MDQTALYEAIFRRRSVRKYDLTPLVQDTLTEIRGYMKTIQPLDRSIAIEMKLMSVGQIQSILPKAPHYIAIFSEKKPGYLTNVGFILQQMDLFLSAKGIGSCWQGWPKVNHQGLESSKLDFVIVLAFGKAKEALYRNSILEFKRKSLSQITDITGANDLLEPARLAPFAGEESWFFSGAPELIHAYCSKTALLGAFLFHKTNRINVGIALCHLWLAAGFFGKKAEFVVDQTARNKYLTIYEYIISIQIT